MKVTVDEIIDALREANTYTVVPTYTALARRIKAHGIAPPDGYVLVPVEDCGSCGDTGRLSMGYMSGHINCHCCSNPVSRYNQNKAMLSAVKEKE